MTGKSNLSSMKSSKWLFLLLFFIGDISYSIAQAPVTYWWNDAVFYEVFVRSFKDDNGDGKGDFRGLIDKLDYLNDGDPSTHHDLGVTAIWLMPIQQSPSYHGYDVIDYRTVEQDYGTNDDFKEFMDEAHARGIKVIIDYVMNHTSSQHPWFVESSNPLSAKRDWYVWEDVKPTYLGPWNQQVWHARNSSNYYGIFWSGMPDLNYNTQAVKDEMFDIAEFWLEEMNVDGFRLDAIKYIYEDGSVIEDLPETIEFWKSFKTHYKSINPDALSVGEAWTTTEKIEGYMADTTLDFCFEFDLATAIMNAAKNSSVSALNTQVNKVMAAYPYLQFGSFLTNHDMNRAMDDFGNSVPKAKLAASLLMTLPGVPYIYYGEEIGMNGISPDENRRKPLQWENSTQAGFTSGTPWRSINSDYKVKNIFDQRKDYTSLWNNYRALIAIRNNQVALRKGTYASITSSLGSTYAFLREYEDEGVMVVSNTSVNAATNVQLNLSGSDITPGTYTLVELQGGTSNTVVVDGSGGFSSLIIPQIGARSTLIYKLLDASEVTTAVTFEVDMNKMITDGDFNVATETVDITASFNSFGSTLTTLTDGNSDGIYSVTLSNINIGSLQQYKYRINGVNDGREEFSTTTFLRQYNVLEGAHTVKDVYQKQEAFTTSLISSLESTTYIYPIPTEDNIYVSSMEGFKGVLDYSISDLIGNTLITSSFVSAEHVGQLSISCDGLSAGVYLLTLHYNEINEVFKVVIQ